MNYKISYESMKVPFCSFFKMLVCYKKHHYTQKKVEIHDGTLRKREN